MRRLFKRKPAWIRSDNIVGHKPTFRITCKMCRPWWRPKVKMVLRNSKLMISKREEGNEEIKVHINRLNYKCPHCDWVTGFFWPDETEYIEKIFKLRGEIDVYYPGIEEWSKNKLIKEKLESLGYF